MENDSNILDIIIVNCKSTDYLLHCLRSIYDNLPEIGAKIFVEDNASDDGVDRVTSIFPQVLLSKNRYNVGFAKAANRGMLLGTAPYVIILNPDTVVKRGFFETILAYMEENPDVGVGGPKILNSDGSVQGSARSFPTPMTAFFGRSSFLTRWFPRNRFSRRNVLTTLSDGVTPMEVDWVSGACMVVRRKAIDEVGPMDERFFMYWEDADWCKRMWDSGWKVIYFPRSSIVHYVGASSQKLVLRSAIEFHRSCYRLFMKHSGPALRFAKPVVISGLALRFLVSLFSHKAPEKGDPI
jgi:GT2 family glycosyltransferase